MSSLERPRLNAPLHPIIAGRAAVSPRVIDVFDKFTQKPAAAIGVADRAMVERAIAAASSANTAMRKLPTHRRRAAIDHVIQSLIARHEEFARWLAVECGKPIIEARAEVTRAIDTFRFAADECGRARGEVMPLDTVPRLEGYHATWTRVPVGACSFITPFNFPLNLAAHKIAPALAVGCAFVLKPDPRTPITSLLLGEILAGAGLPEGAFSIVPCVDDGLELFSEDERLALLSFTGSPKVGWMLKSRAKRQRVTLELGGNAACIVDRTADLDFAARRIAVGAFTNAGQSCISVQRVLVHESVRDRFVECLLAAVSRLRTGDPLDERTTLGPMISEAEARRAAEWIDAAVAAGAGRLAGGDRRGSILEPTVLADVPATCSAWNDELFAPALAVNTFSEIASVITQVNASIYGLQTGVFTNDLSVAHRLIDELEVGGVVVNDVPTTRSDAMPYGGVKGSGLGREGVRFAMDEMSEHKVVVWNTAPRSH